MNAAQSDELPGDDGVAGGEMNGRTCIVTRESGTPETLIRFVAAPDGAVVPDLKRELPGRGCWVKAERALVDKAVAKKLFARALKADVKASGDLGAMVDRLLVKQLTGMMNLARKAGQLVIGSMKVDAAVRSGEALAVFHSLDAADDGVRKIDQARKAWHLGMETEEEIPSFRFFNDAELEDLMGQNAFIHAAALAGQAGEGVVKRANLLEQYRNGGQSRASGGAGRQRQ
ncbi:RNA-binding protein [Metarhizobium album]|uniref:RNA-binding protein n=1 Tax=Metarhizobium album TaxID=2182425 RepID=A0A2U2DSK4_9HYPH|nr:RNA-binding protein [Rhizobium album]PWE56278.1 RNA-binding protein [Rhizobium album]